MKLQGKIYLMLVPFLLLSCADILDVEPISIIGAESFWNTEEDARGGVQGMYVLQRNHLAYNLLWWGEARGETLSYGLQAPEGRERYFENNLTPVNAGPNWRSLYWIIHQTNLGIKYIPDIGFADASEKNRLLAQAYAMRAHVYYLMVRTWGDVPLVLEPTEGIEAGEIFIPRTSAEEVFAQIKSDIDQSLSLFPNTQISDRGVWSAPSVNALKADVYLWTGKRLNGGNTDFQAALDATEAVEQSSISLLENFGDIFDFNNKKNDEILLTAHYGRDESGANYGSEMYIRGDQIPGATDDETRDQLGEGGGLNRVSPSPLLRSQFQENDLRKDVTFTEIYTFDGGEAELFASVSNKFRGTVEDGSRLFLDDLIIYRYADVVLLKAEAKNALGQDPTPELNMIRNRAGLESYTGLTDQESLDNAILQERLFELAHEGKRWWDLVRFGKAFERVPSLQGQTRDDCLLLWPISTETITLNSQIDQNPCY